MSLKTIAAVAFALGASAAVPAGVASGPDEGVLLKPWGCAAVAAGIMDGGGCTARHAIMLSMGPDPGGRSAKPAEPPSQPPAKPADDERREKPEPPVERHEGTPTR